MNPENNRPIISDEEDVRLTELNKLETHFCKKCSANTMHVYQGGRPRLSRGWKCIPCRENTYQEMLDAYKRRMDLECIKCHGGGNGNNSGMFYKINCVQKYVCDDCIRCEECGKVIDSEESRIYTGEHREQVFHISCYERAYNYYRQPGCNRPFDPAKKTALYLEAPVSGRNRY
jgi:hypothetical protein